MFSKEDRPARGLSASRESCCDGLDSGEQGSEQELYSHWSKSLDNFPIEIELPEGLLGDTAKAIYDTSIRPVPKIALSAAIAFMAGLTGRAYNISGTGLNQYLMVVGKSGIGKDVISSGIELIVSQVRGEGETGVKCITDFIGAGDFTSYAGGYQVLCGPSQSIVCTFGEFGKKLAEMATNKNPHLIGLSRLLLQAYSKSGEGQVLRPISYADKDRKTSTLFRPSLTIIAETTPAIYGILNEAMIEEGTLPRMLWVDVPDERPGRNPTPAKAIPSATCEAISNLAAICLTNASQQKPPIPVGFNPEDASGPIFDTFDKWCDGQIVGNGSEAVRELWNRAHLKALKLAALQAVCANPHHPFITEHWARWAIDFVHNQTLRLANKFANGEVGEQEGNEAKQISEVIRVIGEYTTGEYSRFDKYGGSFEMHRDRVFTEAYIQRRLITLKAFKPYPTKAIKQAIKSLLEADELRELPKSQMQQAYGNGARSFVVSNPKRFLPSV